MTAGRPGNTKTIYFARGGESVRGDYVVVPKTRITGDGGSRGSKHSWSADTQTHHTQHTKQHIDDEDAPV